jgi:hypothetical protein
VVVFECNIVTASAINVHPSETLAHLSRFGYSHCLPYGRHLMPFAEDQMTTVSFPMIGSIPRGIVADCLVAAGVFRDTGAGCR